MDKISVANKFDFKGIVSNVAPYGNGHINDTYAVVCNTADGDVRYILQRLNSNVFPDREGLMRNMIYVTTFLHDAVIKDGGNPEKECLNLIPTKEGKMYLTDENGDVWRATQFIENTEAYLVADDKEMLRDAGRAFGQFSARLADFDASSLVEIISRFHDTVDRYNKFQAVLDLNKAGRKENAEKEIDFVLQRKGICGTIVERLQEGILPVRVTHNDTKLNNALIDVTTKKAVCVIDLDTVMPGSILYDFGDGVRAGCSTGKEDEQNLDLVDFDLNLFSAFASGYLEGLGESVTDEEIALMPMAARLITFECGMRFLTDYLDGDTYFKTAYQEHNLVRARTQFKLVKRMEELHDEMCKAVESATRTNRK